MKTIIESQYFPCIEYFHILKNRTDVWIESKEHFEKQTYRNRCYILTADRVLPLAIPMQGGNKNIPIDGAREAGIFHHLITLPTYHTTALHMNDLTKGYFGNEGMLAYVKGVQRQEIRKGVSCVKHQRMAGSDLGDDHKTFFAGDNALKAGGENNTSNQFKIATAQIKVDVPAA